MGDVPFGFGRDDDDNTPSEGSEPGNQPVPAGAGGDPFAALFGGFGGAGAPPDLGAAFQRLGQLLLTDDAGASWYPVSF